MSRARRRAREAALQVLYFWQVGRGDPAEAVDAYFQTHWPDADAEDRARVERAVMGTVADLAEIDALIARHASHWRPERMAIVDRLILRLSIWELRQMPETPPAVILNEAVELARRFSAPDATRFVNGVLDAVRQAVRPPAPDAV